MKIDAEAEARTLVIARLTTMPPNRKISIGSYGDFSKDELIKSVERGDEVGKKFIEIQIAYLKAMAKGMTA